MWEKIKKFFKWIADHTGISWVARKVKSGLKWLFGGKASATQGQQERSSDSKTQGPAQSQDLEIELDEFSGDDLSLDSNGPVSSATSNEHQKPVEPSAGGKSEEASSGNYLKVEETQNSKELKRESSTINVFNGGLELRLADDIQQKLEDYKHQKNNGKYRIKIHCNESNFNINFSERDGHLFINTLQKIGDKQVLDTIGKIKRALGFKRGSTSVAIDFICKYQSVESPKLEVPTNNGVPSSETTSPEAEQHTVDTDLSVNA